MQIHYVIIINYYAGGQKVRSVWPELQTILNDREISYEVHDSKYAGYAESFANAYADQHIENQVLLVIGGDGTLHQVLNGLYQARKNVKIPVAYVPCGTGNDFARGIGISQNPKEALNQALSATEPIEYDIGYYVDHTNDETGVFSNNFGIGFDANIVYHTNTSKTKNWLNHLRLGSLSYIASGVRAFRHQRPFTIKVGVDHETFKFNKAFLVTATNHPYFGGGVPLMPTADMKDGKIDLVVIEAHHLWEYLGIIRSIIKRKSDENYQIHHFQASHIRLLVPSPQFGQLDGEVKLKQPFDLAFSTKHQYFWINPSKSHNVIDN